jgi:hypothetical protein
MRTLTVLLMAALLSGCAGAYVAVDGGAHAGDVRIGQDGSR